MCQFLSCLTAAILLALPLSAEENFHLDTTAPERIAPASRFGYADVVKGVRPAVVSVFPTRILHDQAASRDDLMRRFFNRPGDKSPGDADGERREEQGIGSGVLISADGLILTNNHVVAGEGGVAADELSVELADRRRFTARLIGRDPLTDIAVLRIPAEDLPFIPLADSRRIEIGDVAFAVGNPFKVGLTVTMGIISATDRADLNVLDRNGYELFIQTDAPINPGNSGGALVDVRGRLIGINTAIIGGSGGSVGIGFAVPTRLAHAVLLRLLETQKVERAFLGTAIDDVTPELAISAGLPAVAGVVIREVGAGLPAAKGGLLPGDIVTAINDDPVATKGAFRTLAAYSPIGKPAIFSLYRDGKFIQLPVIPGSRETPEADARAAEQPVELAPNLRALPLTAALRTANKLPADLEGLLIQPPAGGELPGDLKAGEVIVRINDLPAADLAARDALHPGINKLQLYSTNRTRHAILRLP